jgi:dTMP kinase
MEKGMLITFEGLDGCGKTTQINHFIEKLKKHSYHYLLLREPGGSSIGEKIRDILLDKTNIEMTDVAELLLYSASRNQLCREKIRPALAKQTIVICDRFYDSTTAYQGYARGIDLEFIQKLNMIATDNLIPDLTFLLDISLETRFSRLDKKNLDRLEQEHLDFHRKVRSGFLQMAEKEPGRFVKIDGTASISEINQILWKEFLNKITLENKK